VLLVAGWVGSGPGLGLALFAILVAFALAVELSARRSETVRGLLDQGDERIRGIDLAATAVAGLAVITAVIAAFVVEVFRGRDGTPYSWLGAIGGVSYIVAVVVLRVRG
jgi:hypothetical protein